jgi:hypothetical protein
MEKPTDKARCVHCRSEVVVPGSYAHGDHIKCGACGMQHRVVRGEVLRLVIADVAPLQEMLRENEHRVETLREQLRTAQASLGIGANGFGLGVVYLVYQVGLKDVTLSPTLFWQATGIALATGGLLELLNWLFLAKRQRITQISEEITTLQAEGRQLQQKIREASRV